MEHKDVSSRSTSQKALRLNLDDKKYGTIVEIGAGQEVARQFFIAGAAAGTIAKTMSAYDMKFSDAIYGVQEDGRYVSKARVKAMMAQEYDLVLERVSDVRSKSSRYFAYAATVAAKSFNRQNECHAQADQYLMFAVIVSTVPECFLVMASVPPGTDSSAGNG